VKTGHFSFNSVKTGDGWFTTFEANIFGSYRSSLANPLAKMATKERGKVGDIAW